MYKNTSQVEVKMQQKKMIFFNKKQCKKLSIKKYLSILSIIFLTIIPVFTFANVGQAINQHIETLDALNKVEDPACQAPSCLNNSLSDPDSDICPEVLIRQAVEDSRGMMASPNEVCVSDIKSSSLFSSAGELETYIQNSPHFSDLNFSTIHICLSQPVVVEQTVGQFSARSVKSTLPQDRYNTVVAEYYADLYRLNQGVIKNLSDISAIDQIIGADEKLLSDVSCSDLDSLSGSTRKYCEELRGCNSAEESRLAEYGRATLVAMKGISAIDEEIKKLKGLRHRDFAKNKDKITLLEMEKENLQNMYPWITGRKFQSSYDAEDFTDFDPSKENEEMKTKMAGLIREQLTHTREKLLEHQENLNKAVECLNTNSSCSEVDLNELVAKTPAIESGVIFERDRIKDNKAKEDTSQSQLREDMRLSEVDTLFSQVECFQEQREAKEKLDKTVAMGALDVGVVLGTMGMGAPIVGAKLAATAAIRGGRAINAAQKLSKTQKLQGLGVIGTDVSLSSPYMSQAVEMCDQFLNQLEDTTTEDTDKSSEGDDVCRSLPLQSKLTSDLKSCILEATLASLPIVLPFAGLAVTGLLFRKGTQKVFGGVKSRLKESAESSIGRSVSDEQAEAIERAHLVGEGIGKDGVNPAGIGNYTQAHIREKARILKEAGFSRAEIRKLMEDGVVGDFDDLNSMMQGMTEGVMGAAGGMMKGMGDMVGQAIMANTSSVKDFIKQVKKIKKKEGGAIVKNHVIDSNLDTLFNNFQLSNREINQLLNLSNRQTSLRILDHALKASKDPKEFLSWFNQAKKMKVADSAVSQMFYNNSDTFLAMNPSPDRALDLLKFVTNERNSISETIGFIETVVQKIQRPSDLISFLSGVSKNKGIFPNNLSTGVGLNSPHILELSRSMSTGQKRRLKRILDSIAPGRFDFIE